MPLVPPNPPAPTPEYESVAGQGMDGLARLGDDILREVNGTESKDPSRNSQMPRRLAGLVALRAQGYDNQEIAEKLGISRQKVAALIVKARKEYGWSDLGEKIAHRAVPQAVDNLVKHLEYEGTAKAVEKGMSAVTQRTLAGVGVFKTHSAVKQESKSEQTNVLRVEISIPELPSGTSTQVEGVLASPRRAALPPVIEAEVVK